MERTHRNRINSRFYSQMKGKPLVVLGIPEDYDYMQPELVRLRGFSDGSGTTRA